MADGACARPNGLWNQFHRRDLGTRAGGSPTRPASRTWLGGPNGRTKSTSISKSISKLEPEPVPVEAGSGSCRPGPIRGLGDYPASCVGFAMNTNGKIVPAARPNPRVRSPLLILHCTADGWIGQFPETRAELWLGNRKASLYQVVKLVRSRWPNARVAMDEVILEDGM